MTPDCICSHTLGAHNHAGTEEKYCVECPCAAYETGHEEVSGELYTRAGKKDPASDILRGLADFLDARASEDPSKLALSTSILPVLSFSGGASKVKLFARLYNDGSISDVCYKDLQILMGPNKINAIKRVRDLMISLGLRDAKDFIEELNPSASVSAASWRPS